VVMKTKRDIIIKKINMSSSLLSYLLFLNALQYMKIMDLLVIEFCFLLILAIANIFL
jgi:hypothetical protein